MPRYFFDTRDNDVFVTDEVGLDFPDLESCKKEAARALAEIAREVLPGAIRRELAVEVRDEAKRPLLRAALIFEVKLLT